MTSPEWKELQEKSNHDLITEILALRVYNEKLHNSAMLAEEVRRLRERVTELQALGSKHVIERQNMNAYGGRERRQWMALQWATRVFGPNVKNFAERAMRLVEESVEAAQAVGVQEETLHRIVSFVYSKPAGVVERELGGVAFTLMCFCEAVGCKVESVERDELERVMSFGEEFLRSKHAAKVREGIAQDCQ